VTVAEPIVENAFAGRLEDVPLADIIQVLQVSAKTGALLLHRGDGYEALIAFRGGAIIQTTSTESYQSLGDRLIANGALAQNDIREALQYLAQCPGMRLGDALVELGYIRRSVIEEVVKAQMAETIERLTKWTDTEFEFRVGALALPRGTPELALDLIHEKGVEPRHLLLEASLLQDRRDRKGEAPADGPNAGSGAEEPGARAREVEEEAEKIIRWFDEGVPASVPDVEDALGARTAASYLSISEELFAATSRGEIGLLLLRYAAELYADGGLVLRTKQGFRVLGQFGEAFAWPDGRNREPKTSFAAGECPLFETIATSKRPYVGFVALNEAGGLTPVAPPAVAGVRVVLAIPLFVLGDVSLILFCRSALAGAPDARALIALARQVSVTLENAALRELAKRAAADRSAILRRPR
jgi:hypothetical protein